MMAKTPLTVGKEWGYTERRRRSFLLKEKPNKRNHPSSRKKIHNRKKKHTQGSNSSGHADLNMFKKD